MIDGWFKSEEGQKDFTNFTKFIKNLKEILNTEELKNLYKKKILFDKNLKLLQKNYRSLSNNSNNVEKMHSLLKK